MAEGSHGQKMEIAFVVNGENVPVEANLHEALRVAVQPGGGAPVVKLSKLTA